MRRKPPAHPLFFLATITMKAPFLREILGFRERIDLLLRVLLTASVCVGCYLIVSPFLTAIIIAAILAVVTWPLFLKVRAACRERATLAATAMVSGIIVVFLIPISFLLVASAQQIPKAVRLLRAWIASGFQVPTWISEIPFVGDWLHNELVTTLDPHTLTDTLQKALEPAASAVLGTAVNVSNALMQLALVTFIVFFFYRDGARFGEHVKTFLNRIGGDMSGELGAILVNTTRSAVFGIIGTAMAQGVVAGIGFWIVDMPGTLLLGLAVTALSVVPIGPPLVWIPCAVWLYTQGEIGMAVFLVLWGTLAVSSVDNFLKPFLIARGTPLPLALVFLGVFGGLISFGFLGLILGPVLLSIGMALLQAWLKRPLLNRPLGGMSSEKTSDVPLNLDKESDGKK